MSSLSQNNGLARPNLYRSLATGGDPKLSTVLKVLQALGVGLSKVVSHRPVSGTEAAAPDTACNGHQVNP